jgi:enamine deaminase RidA (YjgF/YER057c/UK114 family)
MGVNEKLKELGLVVKEPSGPRGKLAPAVRSGNLVFTSGNTSPQIGKVGAEVSLEEAYQGAREAILSCLGAVKWLVSDLNKITRVVKLLGMVNCTEGFIKTPEVIHGATDLLLELFGPEAGWHARSAVGLYQLPGNCAVEIELIVEVKE